MRRRKNAKNYLQSIRIASIASLECKSMMTISKYLLRFSSTLQADENKTRNFDLRAFETKAVCFGLATEPIGTKFSPPGEGEFSPFGWSRAVSKKRTILLTTELACSKRSDIVGKVANWGKGVKKRAPRCPSILPVSFSHAVLLAVALFFAPIPAN